LIMKLTVQFLKLRARHHLLKYRDLTEGLSCGRTLAEEIRPQAHLHKLKFNMIMNRLGSMDPSCPAARL